MNISINGNVTDPESIQMPDLSTRKGKMYMVDPLMQKRDEKSSWTDKQFQDHLRKLANKDCERCFGKGYTGRNIDNGIYQSCKCVMKKERE